MVSMMSAADYVPLFIYRHVQQILELQIWRVAHMRRAIMHGAMKRALLQAIQSAAVPGDSLTCSVGVQVLMQHDSEGTFKNS
jgi:hypothetical protein